MEIKAIKNIQMPRYPTKVFFESYPEKLLEHVPASWKKQKIILAAMSAFLLSTINKATANNSIADTTIIKENDSSSRVKNRGNEERIKSEKLTRWVAPIFSHGNGRATLGCIVMSPPAFVSESDAKKIITEIGEEHGIHFDTAGQHSSGVQLKYTEIVRTEKKPGAENRWGLVCEERKELLKYDGYDPTLGIGFIYVSTRDNNKFRNKNCRHVSSVWSVNTKKLAKNLRDSLKKSNDANAVVFYDPLPYLFNYENKPNCSELNNKVVKEYELDSTLVANCTEDSENLRKIGKMGAQTLLKKQVRDFIEWALKEKIITK